MTSKMIVNFGNREAGTLRISKSEIKSMNIILVNRLRLSLGFTLKSLIKLLASYKSLNICVRSWTGVINTRLLIYLGFIEPFYV